MSDHADDHGDQHYIKIWGYLLILLAISFVGPIAEIQWLTLLTAFRDCLHHRPEPVDPAAPPAQLGGGLVRVGAGDAADLPRRPHPAADARVQGAGDDDEGNHGLAGDDHVTVGPNGASVLRRAVAHWGLELKPLEDQAIWGCSHLGLNPFGFSPKWPQSEMATGTNVYSPK